MVVGGEVGMVGGRWACVFLFGAWFRLVVGCTTTGSLELGHPKALSFCG